MAELNGLRCKVLSIQNPWMFTIDTDTREFGDYVDGGLFVERRKVITMPFRSLRDAVERPGTFVMVGGSSFSAYSCSRFVWRLV